MDDNTGIVLFLAIIVAGIVLVSWSRSWASRAANRYDAEQTRAQAELIRAETHRDQQVDAQRRDLADGWDDGYEAAARFHEGSDARARTNPYRAVSG